MLDLLGFANSLGFACLGFVTLRGALGGRLGYVGAFLVTMTWMSRWWFVRDDEPMLFESGTFAVIAAASVAFWLVPHRAIGGWRMLAVLGAVVVGVGVVLESLRPRIEPFLIREYLVNLALLVFVTRGFWLGWRYLSRGGRLVSNVTAVGTSTYLRASPSNGATLEHPLLFRSLAFIGGYFPGESASLLRHISVCAAQRGSVITTREFLEWLGFGKLMLALLFATASITYAAFLIVNVPFTGWTGATVAVLKMILALALWMPIRREDRSPVPGIIE